MERSLSSHHREEMLVEMADGGLDLLIIGGGITGAGIAWDAAKRGLRTGLIERRDFSSGTSSRSTKLVHGGLRYLKKGEWRLVMETGRERAILRKSVPHLVKPEPMLLPIYRNGSLGYRSTGLGLMLYDRLAGVGKAERRAMHRRDEALKLEPLLKEDGLIGAGTYYEYRTDDARLTIEVLKTAARHGALAVNYAEAAGFIYAGNKVSGVRVIDRLTGREYEVKAKKVVNAAGPWVDQVRSGDHAVRGKKLQLTKGVHLTVEHSRLPVRQAVYFDVPDGRMIFVIPRDGKTYMGTTDTFYSGSLDSPRVSDADRDYLLRAVNQAFPGVHLTPEDVHSMWAGLRPLIQEEGKKPSELSRRDEIWVSSSGLITIAGGKLTGFRKMAERVVDRVVRELAGEGQIFAPCTTNREVLSGGDGGRFESFEELQEELLRHGTSKGLPIETVKYLLNTYGSNAMDIFTRIEGQDLRTLKESIYGSGLPNETEPEKMEKELGVSSSPIADATAEAENAEGQPDGNGSGADPLEKAADGKTELGEGLSETEHRVLAAEISYCIGHEMIVSAADFLLRRTGLLLFDRSRAEAIALDVLELLAKKLGWSDDRLEEERRELAAEWEIATKTVAEE